MLDNVATRHLLEPEYLDRLPRDGRVDLIATTRLAPASIPGSAQDQTFIAVDELPEEDALALLRSHQPEGRFPVQAEDDEARAIARLLEASPSPSRPPPSTSAATPAPTPAVDSASGCENELLAESETTAGDPTVAVRHRERLLARTLAFTFETLTPEAMHLLTLASLLPADCDRAAVAPGRGGEQVPDAFHELTPAGPNSVFARLWTCSSACACSSRPM